MKKTIALALVVGSSLVAAQPTASSSSSKQANTMEPGMALKNGQLQPAFSQSARFESADSWDCTFEAAFTYFHASQDDMETVVPKIISNNTVDGPTHAQKFEYQPGFEVGVTVNTPYDKWTVGVGYLWYRSDTSSSHVAGPNNSFNTQWFTHNLHTVQSKWHLGIDQVDLYASRPFYSGQRLTMSPYFGLKSNWIRQTMTVTGLEVNLSTIDTTTAKSHAWGIGPEVGLQANFLLDQGFAFFGNVGASILYTNYSTLSFTAVQPPITHVGSQNGYSALRTNLNTGLGVEWGMYLDDQSYFLHFSASYDFSVFFNQNMIRRLIGTDTNNGNAIGSLYLHGLTASASFLF